MAKALGDACAPDGPRRRALDEGNALCRRSPSSTTARGTCTRSRARIARVGGDPAVTGDPAEVARADALVIPGVGHFGACVRAICHHGLDAAIRDVPRDRAAPCSASAWGCRCCSRGATRTPRRDSACCPAASRRLPDDVKVPHMGWNTVTWTRAAPVRRRDLPTARASTSCTRSRPTSSDDAVGVTEHGRPFAAAVARDNVFATQFHPEKSGEAGLQIYERFVKAVARRMIVIPAIDLRGGRAVRLLRGNPDGRDRVRRRPGRGRRALPGRGRPPAARRRPRRRARAGRQPRGGPRRSATRSRSRCRWAAGSARSRTIGALHGGTARRARSWGPRPRSTTRFVARAVEEFAERVVVAVDVRGGRVMVRGWQEEGPMLEETVAALDDAGTPAVPRDLDRARRHAGRSRPAPLHAGAEAHRHAR